jgi:hypothetical protein
MRVVLVLMLVACGSRNEPVATPLVSAPAETTIEPVPTVGNTAPTPAAKYASPSPPGSIVQWEPLVNPFLAERIRAEQNLRCAISKAGRVACWGRVRAYDDGPAELRAGLATPMMVKGLEDVADIAVASPLLCYVKRSGDQGCLLFSDTESAPPTFPSPPVELGSDGWRICARLHDGEVGCGSLDGYSRIAGIAKASHLACGGGTCCAVTRAGLSCFDTSNKDAKLSPVKITPDEVVTLVVDRDSGCVRTRAGAWQCWGEAKDLALPRGPRAVIAMHEGLCAILDDGNVKCAGRTPASTNVVDGNQGCFVHRDGGVSCWGYNDYGECGDGHPLIRLAPTRVPTVEHAIDLRVSHTGGCAVIDKGGLTCWGGGPLARFSRSNFSLAWGQYISSCLIQPPRDVHCMVPRPDGWDRETIDLTKGPQTVKTMAIDRVPTFCIVDDAGKTLCRFGMGYNGVDPKWTPLVTAGAVEELQPVSTGFCARLANGTVSCFHDERFDEDDKFVEKLPQRKMTPVDGIKDVVQIAGGSSIACARTKSGEVWCWNVERPGKWELPSLKGATWIAANDRHQCAILKGEVWCWGDNSHGQLGDGTVSGRLDRTKDPVKAKAPFVAVKVGVGRDSTCALDDQGQVWCWGGDKYAELGQGRPLSIDTPIRVVGFGP